MEDCHPSVGSARVSAQIGERKRAEPGWVVDATCSGDMRDSAHARDRPARLAEWIGVADLDIGVRWAVDQGATEAEHQPQADVRVMLDPDGHPFCLFPDDSL